MRIHICSHFTEFFLASVLIVDDKRVKFCGV